MHLVDIYLVQAPILVKLSFIYSTTHYISKIGFQSELKTQAQPYDVCNHNSQA